MTTMIEVKTADLIGPALDWVVAKVEGEQYARICNFDGDINAIYTETTDYSTDWAHGGPLIENLQVMLCYPTSDGDPWEASLLGDPDWHYGDRPLIAACRAIVAAKLGDVVSVPAELVQVVPA